MPIILAIETATNACSAALYKDGKISSRYEVAPQQHAKLILNMCDDLLRENNVSPSQLTAVAFGRGPGSFTGVRIATACTQGIAMAHNLPVIPVSTLQILAQVMYLKTGDKKIVASLDARMNERYVGVFELKNGVMEPVEDEKIVPAGNYVHAPDLFPTAEALLQIALTREPVPVELALPVYLRDNVAF